MKAVTIRVVSPKLWDVGNDNIDVEVSVEDGSRYGATFFTLANIESLFRKNAGSGECASGSYLWASNMIVVRDLSMATIERTVASLLESLEFDQAFAKL